MFSIDKKSEKCKNLNCNEASSPEDSITLYQHSPGWICMYTPGKTSTPLVGMKWMDMWVRICETCLRKTTDELDIIMQSIEFSTLIGALFYILVCCFILFIFIFVRSFKLCTVFEREKHFTIKARSAECY